MVWGLVPSPRIEAATLPPLSTMTTETLKPSLVHCSIVPWMMASAIAIETFFSTCGACAKAGAATATDAAASIVRETRRIVILPVVFAEPYTNHRKRVLVRRAPQYCCGDDEVSA